MASLLSRLLQFDLFGSPQPAPAAPGRCLHRHGDASKGFDYELRRAARKSIGIRVDDDAVRVSAPRWVSVQQIEQVLADKSDWVLRQLQLREQRLREQQRARIDWIDGACVPYLGGELRLRLAGRSLRRAVLDAQAGTLLLPLDAGCAAQTVRASTTAWMREHALARFRERAHEYAQVLGVRVTAVRLSSARTRWGSASADGSLRLHWRLLHFPQHITDYVIAHEVSHLREMNHGPRFWAVVEQICPDWREARRALRASVLVPW